MDIKRDSKYILSRALDIYRFYKWLGITSVTKLNGQKLITWIFSMTRSSNVYGGFNVDLV